ncbi:myosin regulatory light chain cdc4 [Ceratobasidium sp. AG-Ba]|nr:myosin regulatory light chain cdc4 [Ceratobasidium sp. AG-Ba]
MVVARASDTIGNPECYKMHVMRSYVWTATIQTLHLSPTTASLPFTTLTTASAMIPIPEYKEAFALFDKRGTGFVPREQIGDLLRALGQNPTQGEVAEIASNAPREVDYKTFLAILNRPDGFKPAGTPEEFIRGFQVFDKEGNGFIGAGELRYVLTQLGEKMTDEEVDELLKGVQIGPDGNVNYESFTRMILSQ